MSIFLLVQFRTPAHGAVWGFVPESVCSGNTFPGTESYASWVILSAARVTAKGTVPKTKSIRGRAWK